MTNIMVNGKTYDQIKVVADGYKYSIALLDGRFRIDRAKVNGITEGRRVCKEGFDTSTEAYQALKKMEITF